MKLKILAVAAVIMVIVSGCTGGKTKDLVRQAESNASRVESEIYDDNLTQNDTLIRSRIIPGETTTGTSMARGRSVATGTDPKTDLSGFRTKNDNPPTPNSIIGTVTGSNASTQTDTNAKTTKTSVATDATTPTTATSAATMTDPESSITAMGANFAAISALSGAADSGFPGGPVDGKNRPSGPLKYQQEYGKYDAHFIVPDSERVFLTFDEGYENGYTSQILDTLKRKNVKAVFFITLPYAKDQPELIRRMIAEGHVLGNHSSAHKSFPSMPLSEAAADIKKLHDYVKSQYGYEMYLFRPPEGVFSEQVLALVNQLGYKTMLWSFAYADWDPKKQPLTLEATAKIVEKAHPGEICLLHAVSKTNAEILGDVIDGIRKSGLEFASYFYLT